jgi:ankyrin repeat protein
VLQLAQSTHQPNSGESAEGYPARGKKRAGLLSMLSSGTSGWVVTRTHSMLAKLQHVSVLLDAGARMYVTVEDTTCLGVAAGCGNIEVMKLLLKRGVPVNDGIETPLVTASANGRLAAVQFLLDSGADVHQYILVERHGGLSFCNPLFAAASEGHLEVAKLLRAHGAPLAAADVNATSALHQAVAARSLHVALIQWLLTEGSDVTQQDFEGYTPLHYAAQKNRVEVQQLLLQAGADVHAAKAGEVTALHLAVCNYNVETVRFLLDQVECSSLQASLLNTACYNAGTNGSTDCLEALFTCTGYRALSKQQRVELEEQMLAYVQDTATLDVVVKYAADLKPMLLLGGWRSGWNCLHMCAERGSSMQVTCQLIQLGADPAALSTTGQTPADVARANGHTLLAQLLDRATQDYGSKATRQAADTT